MPHEAMHSNPSNIDLSLSDLNPSSSVIELVACADTGRHPSQSRWKERKRAARKDQITRVPSRQNPSVCLFHLKIPFSFPSLWSSDTDSTGGVPTQIWPVVLLSEGLLRF